MTFIQETVISGIDLVPDRVFGDWGDAWFGNTWCPLGVIVISEKYDGDGE